MAVLLTVEGMVVGTVAEVLVLMVVLMVPCTKAVVLLR